MQQTLEVIYCRAASRMDQSELRTRLDQLSDLQLGKGGSLTLNIHWKCLVDK